MRTQTTKKLEGTLFTTPLEIASHRLKTTGLKLRATLSDVEQFVVFLYVLSCLPAAEQKSPL